VVNTLEHERSTRSEQVIARDGQLMVVDAIADKQHDILRGLNRLSRYALVGTRHHQQARGRQHRC
jgi:hypothetical protein